MCGFEINAFELEWSDRFEPCFASPCREFAMNIFGYGLFVTRSACSYIINYCEIFVKLVEVRARQSCDIEVPHRNSTINIFRSIVTLNWRKLMCSRNDTNACHEVAAFQPIVVWLRLLKVAPRIWFVNQVWVLWRFSVLGSYILSLLFVSVIIFIQLRDVDLVGWRPGIS